MQLFLRFLNETILFSIFNLLIIVYNYNWIDSRIIIIIIIRFIFVPWKKGERKERRFFLNPFLSLE